MKNSDQTNKNASFILIIFSLFSSCFDFRSSPGEKDFVEILLKQFIHDKKNDVKYTSGVAYVFVEWKIFSDPIYIYIYIYIYIFKTD